MDPIDNLCFQFLSHLQKGELMELQIPKFVSPVESQDDVAMAEDFADTTQWTTRKLTSKRSMRKYNQFMALAALVAELRGGKKTMLMRDVYYTLKDIFSTQEECNRCILELGRYLRLKRHEMNIIPAAKGYVAGPIAYSFDRVQGEWINCFEGFNNTTAPSSSLSSNLIDARWVSTPIHMIDIHILHPAVQYIIVIEKESIFHRLLEDGFLQRVPCILITSCGYPDVATRAMVARLLQMYPTFTALGICDYNPHGLALLMSFRYTPMATSFEAREFQSDIQWIGLRRKHIDNMLSLSSSHAQDVQRILQPMTDNDQSKLRSLQDNPALTPTMQSEIERMAQGGVKCELEAMYVLGLPVVSQFVEAALEVRDYIT